jgi:prolycopene isomerase
MKEAVIIGTGIGGSAMAALLADKGFSITVLERSSFVGGKAASYEREGFVCDRGVHAAPMGSLGPLGEVARKTGAKLEFVEPRSVFQFITPRRKYDFSANLARPASLMKLAKIAGVRPRNMPGAARLFWKILRVKTEDDVQPYDDISLREFLSSYTDDAGLHGLCDLFTALMFVISSEEASAGEFIWSLSKMFKAGSAGYPKGGFCQISQSYLDTCEEKGGKVILKAEATAIRVEGGKVTGVDAEGGFYPADVVVSNAGIKKTMELAGTENFPVDYVKGVKNLKNSDGGVTVKFALDRRPFDAPVAFWHPDDLDTDRNLEDMSQGRVPSDLPIYMPCPTNFDPSCAPEGKHLLLAGTIVPAVLSMSDVAEEVLDQIEQQVYSLFPGIEEHILWKHRTNLDYVDMMGGRGAGEVIGLAQTYDQVGKNKPDPRMPVEGLYLVGCDAGGRGIGTEQAADSALKVSEMITDSI